MSVLRQRSAIVREMLDSGTVQTLSGETRRLKDHISAADADAMYRVARDVKPEAAIQIGLANGMSALAILTAMEENGRGRLVSLDPYQDVDYGGAALRQIERAGLSHRHAHISEFNVTALPRLMAEGMRIQLGFIDGNHTFEHTLLDAFYLDRMLDVGGALGFDDTNMASVRRVISYWRSHRRVTELAVGPKRYDGRNFAVSLARRALRWQTQNRWFRKDEEYEPHWQFYRSF